MNKDFDSQEYIDLMDAYFRAANYVSAAQLYMLDNPLLRRPISNDDIKKKIVGHWGTVPGQNFVYTHLNRIINKYDLNMILISGPGHGGNFFVANSYLEGTYSEVYPNISQDEEGLRKLCKQFSFPGGISSHVAPETPGSINEGGELGYSLLHAFGAVFDNPSLIATCIVGDGEAETGPLATSWHSNKFLNRASDGVVLPILHLNGYKIANPTIFSRMSHEELESFFKGMGWDPYFVEGDKPKEMHKIMINTLDKCINQIKEIKSDLNSTKNFPMIILRTPKGWTGPKMVDGLEVEGLFRAHQVPISMEKENHLELLEKWLLSYHPEELFDSNGRLIESLRLLTPKGIRRISANPHTNGGNLLRDLRLPDFRKYEFNIKERGKTEASDMTELGSYVRDVFKLNNDSKNFRMFGPDEALSNRLNHVFEYEKRTWNTSLKQNDEFLSQDGRVMDSMLSEHCCEGWLEGYLLTGRHGFFHCYEAFARIVDSMVSQHAKWLKVTKEISWRKDIASLNIILASHVWQQDHNGFTHQDPGFIDHVVNKKSDIVRVYLPADANSLICCFDHVIKTKNYINVIVASKHMRPQWLTMEEAVKHCRNGIGIWEWASNDKGSEPDVVMASCGETPTLETLAAITILRELLPDIRVRMVNVVDLMKLEPDYEHNHGLSDVDYDSIFTKDKPIVFAYHGYPSLIRELTYYRNNRNLSVHGYNEEGTITTPFDMRVQNELDRFHLVIDVINKLNLGNKGSYVLQEMRNKLVYHKEYIDKYGVDIPEVKNWVWTNK